MSQCAVRNQTPDNLSYILSAKEDLVLNIPHAFIYISITKIVITCHIYIIYLLYIQILYICLTRTEKTYAMITYI